MATLTADFEPGVQGATPATTDTGSATPFDAVNVAANVTVKYDGLAYKGNRSVRFKAAASGGAYIGTMHWQSATIGTVTDHWGRLYIYPVVGLQGDRIWQNRTGAGVQAGAINVQPDQSIILQDAALAVVATSTSKLPLRQWTRFEWHFVHSTTVGTARLEMYFGSNVEGTVPDEVISASALNLGANCNEMVWGLGDNDANNEILIDQVVANSTTQVGPAGLSYSVPILSSVPAGHIGPF